MEGRPGCQREKGKWGQKKKPCWRPFFLFAWFISQCPLYLLQGWREHINPLAPAVQQQDGMSVTPDSVRTNSPSLCVPACVRVHLWSTLAVTDHYKTGDKIKPRKTYSFLVSSTLCVCLLDCRGRWEMEVPFWTRLPRACNYEQWSTQTAGLDGWRQREQRFLEKPRCLGGTGGRGCLWWPDSCLAVRSFYLFSSGITHAALTHATGRVFTHSLLNYVSIWLVGGQSFSAAEWNQRRSLRGHGKWLCLVDAALAEPTLPVPGPILTRPSAHSSWL